MEDQVVCPCGGPHKANERPLSQEGQKPQKEPQEAQKGEGEATERGFSGKKNPKETQ